MGCVGSALRTSHDVGNTHDEKGTIVRTEPLSILHVEMQVTIEHAPSPVTPCRFRSGECTGPDCPGAPRALPHYPERLEDGRDAGVGDGLDVTQHLDRCGTCHRSLLVCFHQECQSADRDLWPLRYAIITKAEASLSKEYRSKTGSQPSAVVWEPTVAMLDRRVFRSFQNPRTPHKMSDETDVPLTAYFGRLAKMSARKEMWKAHNAADERLAPRGEEGQPQDLELLVDLERERDAQAAVDERIREINAFATTTGPAALHWLLGLVGDEEWSGEVGVPKKLAVAAFYDQILDWLTDPETARRVYNKAQIEVNAEAVIALIGGPSKPTLSRFRERLLAECREHAGEPGLQGLRLIATALESHTTRQGRR